MKIKVLGSGISVYGFWSFRGFSCNNRSFWMDIQCEPARWSDSLKWWPISAKPFGSQLSMGRMGLGTLIFRFTNPGSYNFIAFFRPTRSMKEDNTFFNEYGSIIGLLAAGPIVAEFGDPFSKDSGNIYEKRAGRCIEQHKWSGPLQVQTMYPWQIGWNFVLASGGDRNHIRLDLNTAHYQGFFLATDRSR